MKNLLIFVIFLVAFSCEKEKQIVNRNTNQQNTMLTDSIKNFTKFDSKGNLLFTGKFQKDKLVDTLFIYSNNTLDFIVKIDSSDKNYVYGTYISKYSSGKNAKISFLRFEKGANIDSVISSSLLYGKETIYKPNGLKSAERWYEIHEKTSVLVKEKTYDGW